jgi:hypothetical protein
MKRFLLLLLLLATPAHADDAVTALMWNSKGTFQGQTRALGWKDIPAQETAIISNPPCNTCASNVSTIVLRYHKMGNTVLACVSGTATKSGSGGTINLQSAIPSGWSPANEQWWYFPAAISGTYALRMGRFAADNQLLIYADGAAGSFTAGQAISVAGGGNACTTYQINQ